MALKAYREQTFKATIKFLEDDSTVGATFRMPRPIDYYSSADGNLNAERQRFLANIFKSFDKPIAKGIKSQERIFASFYSFSFSFFICCQNASHPSRIS